MHPSSLHPVSLQHCHSSRQVHVRVVTSAARSSVLANYIERACLVVQCLHRVVNVVNIYKEGRVVLLFPNNSEQV